MSQTAAEKAKFRGAWEGSDVTDEHIKVLRHRQMLTSAERMAVRLPGAEGSPIPRTGEVVVFKEHFFRGFGLPASDFFSRFLVHFGLQPHHLAPNAFLQLAAFVTLCEGIVGIEPRLDLWRKLFFFKQQSTSTDDPNIKKMTPCGVALVHHRSASSFPKLPLQDSVKKWHMGFFYVKIVDPLHDYINLSPFAIAPPTAKLNWNSSLPKPILEPAADVEVSDPVEIEDEDEVELQSSASEDVEGVVEPEGTESAGPPARGRGGGSKKQRVTVGRRPVPIVAVEAQAAEEDDATATKEATWAEANVVKKALIEQEKHPSEEEARKAAVSQGQPSKRAAGPAKKPATKERRSKTKHDPASRDLHNSQAQAYNALLARIQEVESWTSDLHGRLDQAFSEHNALRGEDARLRQEVDLLQTKKKDREAAHQAKLEQLHAAHADALKQKEASHATNLERLEKLHLEEKARKDATLKEAHTQLVKETVEAQALRSEITHLAQERIVRDREALEEAGRSIFTSTVSLLCLVFFFNVVSFSFLFFLTPHPYSCSPELFRGTREAAEAALEASRDEHRAAGIEVDATAG
ncbi:hypothetical protein D1007_13524 [Hordeum vulgare]|nr:hypothetical protein D1007_13524 [Hordeum vulgare]